MRRQAALPRLIALPMDLSSNQSFRALDPPRARGQANASRSAASWTASQTPTTFWTRRAGRRVSETRETTPPEFRTRQSRCRAPAGAAASSERLQTMTKPAPAKAGTRRGPGTRPGSPGRSGRPAIGSRLVGRRKPRPPLLAQPGPEVPQAARRREELDRRLATRGAGARDDDGPSGAPSDAPSLGRTVTSPSVPVTAPCSSRVGVKTLSAVPAFERRRGPDTRRRRLPSRGPARAAWPWRWLYSGLPNSRRLRPRSAGSITYFSATSSASTPRRSRVRSAETRPKTSPGGWGRT